MDEATRGLLDQLKDAEFIDPEHLQQLQGTARELAGKGQKQDALEILRPVARLMEQVRFTKDEELLLAHSECSDWSWETKDYRWYFDKRTAELFRRFGTNDLAGFYFRRAATSFIEEGKITGSGDPNDWKIQSAMLRDATNAFQSVGLSSDARECKLANKRIIRDHSTNWWLWFKEWCQCIFWCWGESPWRIGLWSLVWIAVFAVVYAMLGLNYQGASIHQFGQAMYFSVVTFTTLGYGDLTVTDGIGQFFAACEALSGVVFTGLFLVTFVRRFGP